MDNPDICAKRQCYVRDQAMTAEQAPKHDRGLFDFAAYCAIHGFSRPPRMGTEERAAVQRTPQVPCKLCPATVDRDVTAAARHLLYACKGATPAAKEAAAKALQAERERVERAAIEQARRGGVTEEQIPELLRKLRMQDYELAGPPPELRHDRTNAVSPRVFERHAARTKEKR